MLAPGPIHGGESIAPPAAAPPASSETIDAETLALMIKSSVMALQHANATGNYSVLRDLGTPLFRERYNLAALATIFGPLRERGVNLTPVMQLAPVLTRPPVRTAQGQLLVVGQFATVPAPIRFELLFLQLEGAWRLDGINVDAAPVPPAAEVPDTKPVAPAGKPPTGKPATTKPASANPPAASR